jgi:hypothetical protein
MEKCWSPNRKLTKLSCGKNNSIIEDPFCQYHNVPTGQILCLDKFSEICLGISIGFSHLALILLNFKACPHTFNKSTCCFFLHKNQPTIRWNL